MPTTTPTKLPPWVNPKISSVERARSSAKFNAQVKRLRSYHEKVSQLKKQP